VLYYEDAVPNDSFKENMSEEDLPLQPIQLNVRDITVVKTQDLLKDMYETYPNFGWPGKEDNNNGEEDIEELMLFNKMVVFDLIDVDLTLSLGAGYELLVPVQKFGMKVDLEIGYGGKIDRGSVRFCGPSLRVWYVTDTRKLYISFMKKPNIIPNFNVNADRGNGDFAFMDFTEESSTLDDVVERVLCDFGPGLRGPQDSSSTTKNTNKSTTAAAVNNNRVPPEGRTIEPSAHCHLLRHLRYHQHHRY